MTAAVGRPTTYSQEIAGKICEMMAEGMSLRQICNLDGMPGKATVFGWLIKHKDFADQYAKAAEQRSEALAEEMLDIADDASNDWMERIGEDGQGIGWQLNGDHVQRSRLRIETRKWLLGKLKPKKYGERVQQELTGPDGGPIKSEATVHLTPDEAYKRMLNG